MEFSSTSCKIHSYLDYSFFSILYSIHYFNQNWPSVQLHFYLRIHDRTSTCVKQDYQPTRIPAEAPCNEQIKSYFSHTYPSLQSLVPTLSPLLVRFLRVYLQADSSRLLATAAYKHQSRLTQSSPKRSYNITDLLMKPPTMPHGNDRCTQARFAVTHTRFRSSSGSFFPRLVLCVFGLRPERHAF